MPSTLKRVTSCVPRTNITGTEVYDLTLECGHRLTMTKRARNSRVDRPAPLRKKCRACEATKGGGP